MTAPERTIDVDVKPNPQPTLDVEPTEITVEGSFALVLRGDDAPAHVHCRLDETLASVAAIEEGNYYVEPDDERTVDVTVEPVAEPVSGSLEVAVGYGAESVDLAVTVEPHSQPRVDGTLAEPRREDVEPTAIDRLTTATGVEPATLGVVAVAVIALATATGTAAVVGGPVAFLGLLVVVAGIAVAVALLLT